MVCIYIVRIDDPCSRRRVERIDDPGSRRVERIDVGNVGNIIDIECDVVGGRHGSDVAGKSQRQTAFVVLWLCGILRKAYHFNSKHYLFEERLTYSGNHSSLKWNTLFSLMFLH
jgi:hypothetical protein